MEFCARCKMFGLVFEKLNGLRFLPELFSVFVTD